MKTKTFNEKLDELLDKFHNELVLMECDRDPRNEGDVDSVFSIARQAIIDLICEAAEHIHTDNAWTVDTDLYYGFCEGSDEFKRNLINIVRGE